METKYIAFFDSGIGGLTLLKDCFRRFPGEKYIYYGDNGNAPYGNRPADEIEKLAREGFSQFENYPLKAAVLACNTVTAVCAERFRQTYAFPIIGVEPAILPASRYARGGKVLLLATRATLQSERMKRLTERCSKMAQIIPYCPAELAGAIERQIQAHGSVNIAQYLPEGKFDAAVLGCTHYIFFKEEIQKQLRCPVFDGNAGTIDHLAKIANICSKKPQKSTKNAVIFLGKAKNINKTVFESRFLL